ncbi:MAG: HNH endonuclease [Planctomycetaceae bacterium]|nr:HNH endonuclease [Planctomycetaceae bacterium]
MPIPRKKIDYVLLKMQNHIIKIDPDIYRQIFNIRRDPPNKKYNSDIASVRIAADGWPVVICSKKPARHIPLARFVMNAKKGQIVDHINRNPLDNRRCNLRFVTKRQNNLNRKCDNGTGFFGVFIRHQGKNLFCAGKFLPKGRKEICFQLPDNPANRALVALARDKFVLQAGDEEYAPLNFPCFKNEPFRSILLNEDLRKYKTERYANAQLEFKFMKNFRRYIRV